MIKTYIGTKIIEAQPMTRGEYVSHRGWEMPKDENPADEGYFLKYPDGYISWSPKPQFEDAYRETTGMNFGLALEAMKKGAKVARSGWNGKGMYLWLLPATNVKKEWVKDPMLLSVFGERDELPCLGSIRMLTATGEVLTGWLASQTDMLADDWQILPA